MTNSIPSSATDALAVVVRDFGRLVGQDPGRLRGLLEDVLGQQARAERPNIEAIVTAAELGVTTALLDSGPPMPERELEGRLVAHGLSPALATYAVGAWIAVLGGEPAVVTEPADATPETPGDRTISPSALAPNASRDDVTALPAGPAPTILVDDEETVPGESGGEPRRRRRHWLIAAGAAVLVLAAVAAVAAVQRGGGNPAAAIATGGTAGTVTSMTTVGATTTVPDPTTAATPTTSVAPTAAAAPTTAPPDATPPPLVVTQPTYDAVLDAASVNVTGSSEPGAAVTVNGGAAVVDPAGNWQFPFTLVEGDNIITVEAADATGNKSTASIAVHYLPPAPSPGATTPTTRKPASGGGPIASSSGPDPVPAAPPQPPPSTTAPPPAPPVAQSDSKSFTASISASNDPQATSLSVLGNDSGAGIHITAVSQGAHGAVSFSSGSVSYRPHTNGPFSDSFRYTITDSLGRTSSATVSVSVACNPSFPCGS
jgi:hypothetical protein